MGGVPSLIDGRYAAYGMRAASPTRGTAAKAADSKPTNKPSTDRTSSDDAVDSGAPRGTYLNIKA